MNLKILIALSLLAFVGQIIYSFYFSESMIKFNQSYNQNQKNLDNLKLRNQSLKVQLAQFTSFDYLQKFTEGLQPINQSFP